MAIKGLRQGLPVIGRAKIGEPNPANAGKMAPPTKFDHIELTTSERDDKGRLFPDVDLMAALIRAGAPTCGGCDRSKALLAATNIEEFALGLPIELEIGLPFDDLELCFPNRLAYYRGRTVYCSGDMETAHRLTLLRTETVNGKQVDVLGPAEKWAGLDVTGSGAAWGKRLCGQGCPDFDVDPPRCKPAARLRFILQAQQHVGGCYEFRTTSWNSIANIQQSLEMVQRITGGPLAWIPLVLSVGYQTVQPKSGRAASRQLIARIGFKGGAQDLLETVHRNLAIRAPMIDQVRKLEATISRKWELSPEEIEEFRHEFDHDNAERDREAGDVIEPEVSDGGGGTVPESSETPESVAPAVVEGESVSGSAEEVHDLASEPAAPAPQEPASLPSSPPATEGSAKADAPAAPPARKNEHLYIDQEERTKLWDAVKARALKLEWDATPALQELLKRIGYGATRDIKKKDFGRALNYALNLKKPT